MNNVGKVFIGLAIAIVFPMFVYYAAVTFLPNNASKALTTPTYPSVSAPEPYERPNCYPDVQAPVAAGSSKAATYGTSVKKVSSYCEQSQKTWDREKQAYDQARQTYDNQMKAYDAASTKAEHDLSFNSALRALLASVLAFAGLGLIFALATVPAVVYGLVSGAAIALIGSVSVLLAEGDSNRILSSVTILSIFILCVILMLVFDIFYQRKTAQALPMVSSNDSDLASTDEPAINPATDQTPSV